VQRLDMRKWAYARELTTECRCPTKPAHAPTRFYHYLLRNMNDRPAEQVVGGRHHVICPSVAAILYISSQHRWAAVRSRWRGVFQYNGYLPFCRRVARSRRRSGHGYGRPEIFQHADQGSISPVRSQLIQAATWQDRKDQDLQVYGPGRWMVQLLIELAVWRVLSRMM